MEIKDQCTVIVSSWDGFADCWPFFVHGLKKYWPDCPWRVLLMTTGSLPQFEGIETLNLREDRGWASNLKRTLEHVSTPYVLYLQEDYWTRHGSGRAAERLQPLCSKSNPLSPSKSSFSRKFFFQNAA